MGCFFYLQDFLHTNIHVRVLLKHLHLIIEMNYNRKNKNIPYIFNFNNITSNFHCAKVNLQQYQQLLKTEHNHCTRKCIKWLNKIDYLKKSKTRSIKLLQQRQPLAGVGVIIVGQLHYIWGFLKSIIQSTNIHRKPKILNILGIKYMYIMLLSIDEAETILKLVERMVFP